MKTLNLTNIVNSDIKYTIQRFPDGQQNVVINRNYKSEINIIDISHIPNIQIKSYLNNWLDLELIVAAVASLRELGVEEIHLYTPYIVGARSDRKFEEGGNNYIKDVIAPVINSLEFKTVTCIDPHSDVLEACIKGFKKEDNLELLEFAAQSLECFNAENQNFIFISPDAGATKKIYKIAEKIGYKGDIITCSKDRDVDGKLTKTIVPVTFEQLKSEKDFIIIDDICDGGATFINIAKTIKDERQSSKIYLIVTHGIFSKGLKELSQYFDGIYTTNSYRTNNTDNEFVMHNEKYMHILKQLNVF
jgi:ribose-phosphate pyrophosphokinase